MARQKSTTFLRKFVALIPPPQRPVEVGSPQQRRRIEKKLGLALPDDLFEFVSLYGSGAFGTEQFSHVISVYNPFSRFYFKVIDDHRRDHKGDLAKDTHGKSHPFFPTPGGLFPCATGEADRELYYLTKGEPNRWPLFACLVSFDFEEFRMGVAEFLYKMFQGSLQSLGDADFFRENQGKFFFEPYS